MQPQSVPQLATAMRQLHECGYVRSEYTGSQGVGRTLLDALNVGDTPSASGPDLGIGVKVKSSRASSSTPITLFTKEPPADTGDETAADLVQKYGTGGAADAADEDATTPNHPVRLYKTVTSPSTEFSADVVDGALYLRTPDDTVYGKYSVRTLTERFLQTYRNLLFVEAATETRDGDTYYQYETATLCLNPDTDQWQASLADGTVTIELRLGYDPESDSVRNHGTAWRLKQDALVDLYQTCVDLLDEEIPVTDLPPVPQTTLVEPDPQSFTLFAN